jgi:hypothetical protein
MSLSSSGSGNNDFIPAPVMDLRFDEGAGSVVNDYAGGLLFDIIGSSPIWGDGYAGFRQSSPVTRLVAQSSKFWNLSEFTFGIWTEIISPAVNTGIIFKLGAPFELSTMEIDYSAGVGGTHFIRALILQSGFSASGVTVEIPESPADKNFFIAHSFKEIGEGLVNISRVALTFDDGVTWYSAENNACRNPVRSPNYRFATRESTGFQVNQNIRNAVLINKLLPFKKMKQLITYKDKV